MMNSRTAITVLVLFLALTSASAAGNRVIVSKRHCTLAVVSEKGDTLFHCGVSAGRGFGNKLMVGDCRTPEGTFYISEIVDASRWTHDFGDGYGKRHGAYGPLFMRLEVPGVRGIGIHGTCFPELIGQRVSDGCVRCSNEDLVKLSFLLEEGDEVTIEGDPERIEGCLPAMSQTALDALKISLTAPEGSIIPYSAISLSIQPLQSSLRSRRGFGSLLRSH